MLAEWHQTIDEINKGLYQAQIAELHQSVERLEAENYTLRQALRQKKILVNILRDYGHATNLDRHTRDEHGNCTHWVCQMVK